ncbi:MAG: ribonuclease HII, partial [Candidatus Helarchaeota archaeon]
TNTKAYASYLLKHLKRPPHCLITEHKADQNYPIVSASSIIAKVIRDRELQKLQQKYSINFGSGYTSDKRTIDFLRTWVKIHKQFPAIVRKSWKTAKNIENELCQIKLDKIK